MAAAIVDIKCLLASNQHVIKEIFIVQVNAPFRSHGTVTSEHAGTNSIEISTNKWLTNRFHGLQPDYGEVANNPGRNDLALYVFTC